MRDALEEGLGVGMTAPTTLRRQPGGIQLNPKIGVIVDV
jgi:hypothetical protein